MTLKSLNFSLLVVTIESDDLSLLADELNKKRIMAPGFFQQAAVVVDIKNADINLDFLQIKAIVAEHEFILAGISGLLSDSQKQTLRADKIAILKSAKKQLAKEVVVDKPAEEELEQDVQQGKVSTINEIKTKLIKGRVRSGQEVHAQDSDLVISGDVSPGAVVIADGNIHVYGALRGRAIAGASGNQSAAVFCRLLAPELVSIGGVYKLSDALPTDSIGKSCVISLHNEKMIFDSLN